MNRFENKVVIVTGSSSGIGKAAALRFAKEGASVVLHGQNLEKLENTHKEFISSGISASKLHIISGAVQDEGIQEKLINNTISHFGKLDILVNNAGISMKTNDDGNSLDSFDLVFAVNVRAVYRLIQLAAPHLEKTKGSIVNVGSGLSERTNPVYMPYSISKAAVNHLTRNFANLLSPKGIRVNCASPGLTITDFVTRHGMPKEQADKRFNSLAEVATCLGRASTADEQADLILYLASPTTTYMTGSVVFNEGGLFSMSHWNLANMKNN